MTAVDLAEINTALCRALGFGDAENITGLILQLSPGKPPIVTVQRLVISDAHTAADRVSTVRTIYDLKPQEQPQ